MMVLYINFYMINQNMHKYIDNLNTRSVYCAFQSVLCVLMDGRYYNVLNLLSVFQARSSLICIQEFISKTDVLPSIYS